MDGIWKDGYGEVVNGWMGKKRLEGWVNEKWCHMKVDRVGQGG